MSGTPYAEVIGDPIGHSRSPAIHLFWLRALGLDGDYRAARVAADALDAYFAGRRSDADWRGCNITIPHKQAATAFVDSVEDGGIGAINCVLPVGGRLVGRNTDVGGVDAALPAGVAAGGRVVLIGGGGAAAAAIAALKSRGLSCDIVVRNPGQGHILLDRLEAEGRVIGFDTVVEAISGSVGIVNASPLGMGGFAAMPDDLLSGLGTMNANGFVLDMVYSPLRTPLLAAAESAGLAAIDGLEMLIGQAALAFGFFFGHAPPRGQDAALRALLTR